MTAERLDILAGALLSLILGYFPPAKHWYEGLSTEWKVTVMGAALLVVTLLIAGISCGGWVILVQCTQSGLWDLILNLITALLLGIASNQGVYRLLVRPFEKTKP